MTPAQHRLNGSKEIPEATIARLPGYLRALTALAGRGSATISSGELAAAAGVNSAQVRKDLSYLGSYGTRGVGYDVEYLLFQIGREVGSSQEWPVVIVGVGNLGTALATYAGFTSRGFRVVALVDAAPDQIGRRVEGLPISDLADLERIITDTGAAIAVISVPPEAAQQICDRLVATGVTSILNFAPCVLSVPAGVTVRKVDLGQELQILAYHEQRKDSQASTAAGRSEQTAAGLNEQTAAGLNEQTAAGLNEQTAAGLNEQTAAGLNEQTGADHEAEPV